MLKFIAYTNLFIAIASTALALGTGLRFGTTEYLLPYLLVIFFATLADYNWHRFLKVKMNIGSATKNDWGKRNLELILTIGIISTVALTVFLFYIPLRIAEWLLVLGAITLFYSFPFHQMGLKRIDVRKVPGLKNLLIAITWTMATFYLPYQLSEMNVSNGLLALMFVERFLFIFAITIPFDMKDLEEDDKAGWKTFPVLFGNKTSLSIANFLLFGMLLTALVQLLLFTTDTGALAAMITGIYALIVFHSKALKGKPLYYPIIVDGAILLYGLLLTGLTL